MIETLLFSPVKGEAVPIEQVPDKTFSDSVMGPSIAVIPSNGVYCAPFDGTISVFARTSHAFCIRSDSGLEVLVHVGIDTVKLNGEGFERYVSVGDSVKRGERILSVNLKLCRRLKLQTVSPVIILNAQGHTEIQRVFGKAFAGESLIMKCVCEALSE